MTLTPQQIRNAQISLEQGNLPDAVDASQHDAMIQLIIDWIRTNVAKANKNEHADPLLNLLVNIATHQIAILETIKTTDQTLLNAIITLKDKCGSTPLSKLVSLNSEAGTEWFINNGADINWGSQNDPNYTLFHVAGANNAVKPLRRLKAAYTAFKQMINKINGGGESPLATAVSNGSSEVAEWLIDNGADICWSDPSEPNFSLIHLAAYRGSSKVLALLLKMGNKDNQFMQSIHFPDGDGFIPIECAVKNDNSEAITLLMENGAEIIRENPNSTYNLFHLAAEYNAFNALEKLKAVYRLASAHELKQAANVTARYNRSEENTPFERALSCDSDKAIDWFIENHFVSCRVDEIDTVVAHFKNRFQTRKDYNAFVKDFNSLLKYITICHTSARYMPVFFKELCKVARA